MTTVDVRCGRPDGTPSDVLLCPSGKDQNVSIDLSGLELPAGRELLPVARDLLVIASYVLLADGAVSRGSNTDPLASRWRRDLRLHIPVEEPDRWNVAAPTLAGLLEFATDDSWAFDFRGTTSSDAQLRLNLVPTEQSSPSCVCLFSGGLDSTAGALRLLERNERPLLVSHWTSNVSRHHREDVLQRLRVLQQGWRFPNPTLHTIRKRGDAADYTQRSRGALYLSAGVAVALQAGLDRLVVPENGVTSLNLAQSGQAVGAMRSRTTHPKTIALFRELLAVLDLPVLIETPFENFTKGDVVRSIIETGGEEIAHATYSCAKSMFATKTQPHCGTCSQCVDRRFAGIWAGWDDSIEVAQHATDVLRDNLADGEQSMYPEQYLRFAFDVLEMTEDQFVSVHDVWRVASLENATRDMHRIHQLISRHAEQVDDSYGKVVARYRREDLSGRLPPRSLLRRIGRLEHRVDDWVRLADRIAASVQPGLRKALAGRQPANEDELQRLIDGLLTAAGSRLNREVPTVQFGIVRTRPDFSSIPVGEVPDLFVEVKLVRARRDLVPVTDAMLADVPKYTSAGRSALFLVYDGAGAIADEEEFSASVEQAGRAKVHVLRG